MRRLSMKSKRRKSETISEAASEEYGVTSSSTANSDEDMKKDVETENSDTPRRGNTRKRSSHGRNILKSNNDDGTSETQAGEEERGNKNINKGGASKRLKKEDQRASTSIKQDPNKKEYEVEKIIAQRTIKGRRQFLVRWKGYSKDSDTWEQDKYLNCPELIEEFLAEDTENQEEVKSEKSENSGKQAKKSPKANKKSRRSRSSVNKQTENDKEVVTPENMKNDKDNQKEFEVEKIIEVHFKKNKTRQFLIRWKGFTAADDTWEPEENLNCPDLIAKFMAKVEKAKNSSVRELRAFRPHTKRYTLATHESGRRLSRRNIDKQRATYHECDA